MKRLFEKMKLLNIQLVIFRFLCLIPIFGCLFIITTKQCEWYDENKILYHLWFMPTLTISIVLLVGYYIGTL